MTRTMEVGNLSIWRPRGGRVGDKGRTTRSPVRTWVAVGLLAASVGAATYVLWTYHAPSRGLVRLFYYTILTNTYISLLPYEPVLFYYATLYPPLQITLSAGLAVLVSGAMDHTTLTWLLGRGRIRRVYADTRLYRVAVDWYGRAPFLLISLAALTPFPYYPVKFLAFASGYPRGKYLAALLTGRLPRFYILALAGRALRIPLWLLVLSFALMAAVSLGGEVRRRWLEPRARPETESGQQSTDDHAEDTAWTTRPSTTQSSSAVDSAAR
jgi:hypothetical protein